MKYRLFRWKWWTIQGGGDVYNAGFLAGLFLGRYLEENALFATTVAAGSDIGYGRDCYPTEEDLKNFFH